MSRHAVIRKERLVESARHVFLRHGYGASVKLIATEAGVSEGSLFKHFKTKADLFKEAMESDFVMESWEAGMMKSGEVLDMRQTLYHLGLQLLARLQVILPCVITAHTSGVSCRDQHHDNTGSGMRFPFSCDALLISCFNSWIRQGRLVMTDPEVKAQVFLGALISYELRKMIFPSNDTPPDKYVMTVVDMTISPSPRTGRKRSASKGVVRASNIGTKG